MTSLNKQIADAIREALLTDEFKKSFIETILSDAGVWEEADKIIYESIKDWDFFLEFDSGEAKVLGGPENSDATICAPVDVCEDVAGSADEIRARIRGIDALAEKLSVTRARLQSALESAP